MDNNFGDEKIELEFAVLSGHQEEVICLETYDIYKDVCFTPCRHLFHHSCLKEYVYGIIDVKCPICKYNLYESIEKKNINFKKIKITDEIKIYNQNRILGSEN